MKSGVVATDSLASLMSKHKQNTQNAMGIHNIVSILSVKFNIS